ncbi:glycosyltransferase family 2 protein [Cellulomonas fengjieae]|uniref:Glycosyltransferase n=1 Tax=Cellulomonas fengjieae TaxID=2819978 RepID=A0ABS3SJH0_9CELL|nr:glycosyltransferase family 2 protein [Cellulomonas fengjieae]MBO3085802.1 glycosyltransferase [Cellulomonas fengjieae]QVI67494.1 glycosyltransferase [Cellulomonas fengjieae]
MTGPLPTVSVVIPVRDDAVELARCLAWLDRQTVAPWEVVVVDNASSDDTAAVAAAWGARVVPEPSVGIPAAAATGYDSARGEVIARLDADSRPDPRWVERIARRMAMDPDLDAVTGSGRFVDLPRAVQKVASGAYLGAYYVLTHLALGHTSLWGSSMALRRDSWLAVRSQVRRHDPEVHDDLDLAFALGPRRRIRFDPYLQVGVSARSLRGHRQRVRRFARACRTLRLNWRTAPPWARWQARLGSGPRTAAADPASRTTPAQEAPGSSGVGIRLLRVPGRGRSSRRPATARRRASRGRR